jgi:ketosteroid isomerase-like protein
MKKINLYLSAITLIMLGLASCTNPKSAGFTDADKAAITKQSTDINAAFNQSKDYKTYVDSYYAENATALYPNSEPVTGRDAILSMLSAFGNDLNVTPTILEIDGRDSLAYVYGTVALTTNAGAEIDHGKYIEIWRKQKDGNWQITYDIFNTSVPMAAETAK